MSRTRGVLGGAVVLAVILHQDFWLWHNPALLFGVLPVGLAYHVAYVGLVTLLMAALVRWAWPAHLEAALPPEPPAEGGG